MLDHFKKSSVAVIGLGGVGAYAAEMLARAGIGKLLILDSDRVSLSNKNRQLLALDSTIGQSKVELMERRVREINPQIEISKIESYLTEENVASLLDGYSIDLLIDAIDTLSPKVALIEYTLKRGIALVSSMGAGAKLDATKVRVADISKSYNCPLAYILRKRLRKLGIGKGFKVIFSEELPITKAIVAVEEQNKKSQVGTISYLPAVFGSVAAQAAIGELIERFKVEE